MNILTSIDLLFPKTTNSFFKDFLPLLESNIAQRNSGFFPKIQTKEADVDLITAQFCLDNQESFLVPIENITNQKKKSIYKYKAISLINLTNRIGKEFCKSIDHVGFNLPWFEKNVHPAILKIRQRFKNACLYHLFPMGENWDFIIPGFEEEILKSKRVDYSLIRKPKMEIVSFDICSTPLTQFDIATPYKYEELVKIFPEAISVPDLRQIWVYLTNPYRIDVCLVLNEIKDGDWSGFFEKSRLN